MRRFTRHQFRITLKIATVRSTKKKMPKNHDKQTLVMKIQRKTEGKIKTRGNKIACMNYFLEIQGWKSW